MMMRYILPLLVAGLSLASTAIDTPPSAFKVSTIGKKFRPGDIFVVIVESQLKPTEWTAKFLGQTLEFFPAEPRKFAAFAAIDLETTPGKASLQIMDQANPPKVLAEQEILIKPRKFRIEKFKVSDKYVTPSKEEEKQIAADSEELKAIFAKSTSDRFFSHNFISPVAGAASGRFGARRILNGIEKSRHGGADLKAKTGTRIHPTGKGKVVLAKETFYLGNTIVVDHGYGLYSYYGHLSKINVKPGDLVDSDGVLGEVGATGRATKAHLHWGIKLHSSRIDPFSLTGLDLRSVIK